MLRQRIIRYINNHAGLIRVPEHTADRVRKLLFTRAELLKKLERMPSLEELADACGISQERAQELLGYVPEVCSLDAPLGAEEDNTLAILLEDTQTPQPFENLVRQELKGNIEGLLEKLEPRQSQILRLRFGMEDGVCYSLEDIRKMLGISKERVRQIEQQAIAKLGQMSAGLGLEDFLL